MSLAKAQIDQYLAFLRSKGLEDQGRTSMRKESVWRHLTEECLPESGIVEVWNALPQAPPLPPPPVIEPAPTVERSPEAIAKSFQEMRKRKHKPNPLQEPAIRVVLRPENEFRVYKPAPVVAVNRYGVVKWVADGRQHKAGDLIRPRVFFGKLMVQFRHEGRTIERAVGSMLEAVGWVKTRKKKERV